MEFSELLSVLDFNTMKTLKLRKIEQKIANLLYLSDPVSSVALISPETICFGDASQFNAIGDRHLAHGIIRAASRRTESNRSPPT